MIDCFGRCQCQAEGGIDVGRLGCGRQENLAGHDAAVGVFPGIEGNPSGETSVRGVAEEAW